MFIVQLISLWFRPAEGQGLVEYALVLVFVAIVVVASLALIGPEVGTVFSQVRNGLAG